ncbi:hypothetical protein [Brunnivagina elsteri]|uniref:hypothetical protein n=1 Tax=Brunnivagina elsteri TaxID=1247191 RepID=UPI001B8048E0|nr:hypothetical protein [Calothrix elsteri]
MTVIFANKYQTSPKINKRPLSKPLSASDVVGELMMGRTPFSSFLASGKECSD